MTTEETKQKDVYALFDDDGEIVRYSDKPIEGAVPFKKPIMKQSTMFQTDDEETPKEYTDKITAPIYEPKNQKPNIMHLYDNTRATKLIQNINQSNVGDDEKKFLINAAKRLNVFNYEKIADYYSHSNEEMQDLMEQLALVIIDFDKAIELGFVQLSEDIRTQYLEFYDEQ